MRSIAPKLPNELLAESSPTANNVWLLRTERLADLSRRVREESMRVNAEFARIERDPGA